MSQRIYIFHLYFLLLSLVYAFTFFLPVVPQFDVVNFADFSEDARGGLC